MDFTAWLVGVVMGAVAVFILARVRPGLVARADTRANAVPVFNDPSGPPAVDPADPNLPDTVNATEIEKIARIPHPDLRELLTTLTTWKPKRHRAEDAFQQSFERHLVKSGYAETAITRHPRLLWTAEDRDPDSDDTRAVPDFSVKRVLVEIKRNITASSDSDRALGQMARYCVAWRRQGPALLIVCNEFDPNLRMFVARTVRGWKAQGVPVVAYFVRSDASDTGSDDEFPAGTFKSEGRS